LTDNADRAALLHLCADVRELDSSHVAELFLSVVCYSNGSDTVLDDDVLVILAVFDLHEGPDIIGRARKPSHIGWAQKPSHRSTQNLRNPRVLG
jgi:hypothetical protein